jgi:putative ABC transport system ATP-binding protein
MADGHRLLRLDPVTGAAIVRADQLYRFFHTGEEEVLALRGVSLTVAAGELVAVTGPSGSGKSTLLACLAGLDEPDGGIVHIGQERISHRPEAERAALRARRIGVLRQAGNLLPHLTIRQNVRLVQGLVSGIARPSPQALLESVGVAARADGRPGQLSGGELARAGLATALANVPEVLLADEPTGELDEATEMTVLDLLRGRADAGMAVVVASHSPAVARIADRSLHLVAGRLGQPEEAVA